MLQHHSQERDVIIQSYSTGQRSFLFFVLTITLSRHVDDGIAVYIFSIPHW